MDVCHLAASAGSDGEAPAAAVADAAPFSAVAADVFAASAASAVGAVAPSAVVSAPPAAVLTGWLFAASCADAPGPASVEASAVPGPASGTSCSAAAGISGPILNFRRSAVDPDGWPLANRSDARNSAGWRCSPQDSYLEGDLCLAIGWHYSRLGSSCSSPGFHSFHRDLAADCTCLLLSRAPPLRQ